MSREAITRYRNTSARCNQHIAYTKGSFLLNTQSPAGTNDVDTFVHNLYSLGTRILLQQTHVPVPWHHMTHKKLCFERRGFTSVASVDSLMQCGLYRPRQIITRNSGKWRNCPPSTYNNALSSVGTMMGGGTISTPKFPPLPNENTDHTVKIV